MTSWPKMVACLVVFSLFPFLACRDGGAPGTGAGDADYDSLVAKLPDEVRANLRDADPVLRFDALTELDPLTPAEKMDLLRILWKMESEPEIQSDMVDVASDTPGPEGTRFLEEIALGPARLIDRDDAFWYLTLPGFIENLNLGVIEEILYQPDLHPDLFTGVLLILEKKGEERSRALLRQVVVEHPNEDMRRYAAFSIGRFKDEESVAFLTERLEVEKSAWVRKGLENAIQHAQEDGSSPS
jgi:HEAT repeat protein